MIIFKPKQSHILITSIKNFNTNWIKVGLLLCVTLICIRGFGQVGQSLTAQSMENHKIEASALRSIQNKGQWDSRIHYRVQLNCGFLFLENGGISYDFIKNEDLQRMHDVKHKHKEEGHHKDSNNPSEKEGHAAINHHGLKVHFEGANPNAIPAGLNSHETNYNYYQGKNKERWASNVLAYKGIEYQDVYEGIDLYLYESGATLKYDFVVAPGANVKDIVLRYEGASSIEQTKEGIKITTSVNDIIESPPIAFQVKNGIYEEVKCIYHLSENGEISFVFPDGYNTDEMLVIDPRLIFSTYSGSTGDNWGFTATYDENANAYSGGIAWNGGAGAGGSFSGNYPATFGAYQTAFAGGGTDVAISKYSEDGSALIYATYLGGDEEDQPMSMIVNSNEDLIILGNTNSDDFPVTTGVVDEIFNDGSIFNTSYDMFITVLSHDGGSLVSSTYVGGDSDDGFNYLEYYYGDNYRSEVIIDSADNIYVASNTTSTDFPVTIGSFDETHNGQQDAVVFKISSDLTNMLWSGYLGGSSRDQASGIDLDNAGNVFVCGVSGGGIQGTTGGLNPNYAGGTNIRGVSPSSFSADGYVAKIAPDGSSVLSATYLQSNDVVFEIAYLLELDIDDNVFVTGVTEGTYQRTSGVYHNGLSAQFIHKLNNDLSTTLAATTYGGNVLTQQLSPTALLVDSCYRVYVAGWGGDVSFNYTTNNRISNFPLTNDGIQTTTDGEDFHLIVFGPDMNSLNYATFYGGNGAGEHVDGGTSRFSPQGVVYEAVCAGCGGTSLFPSTSGVYSVNNQADNCNAAVFKMEFLQNVVQANIENTYIDTVLCGPGEFEFHNKSSNANAFLWYFGDGDSLITNSANSVFHTYDSAGIYTLTLIGSNNGICFEKPVDTAIYTIEINMPPPIDAGEDTTIEQCEVLQLNACCGISYSWSPGTFLTDSTVANPIITVDIADTFYVTITDSLGCEYIDSMSINVIEIEPYIPNIFTPNGDGLNNLMVIDGFCRNIQLDVYNRWGRRVYRSESYQNDFDGLDLPDGMYYYYILKEDDRGVNEEFNGWVKISR